MEQESGRTSGSDAVGGVEPRRGEHIFRLFPTHLLNRMEEGPDLRA
jgi:hypothetical protein